MRGIVPRFLLREPARLRQSGEMVELPKVLYDAMLAVVTTSGDHVNAYLAESNSPGQWELDVHQSRVALFTAITHLDEVNR